MVNLVENRMAVAHSSEVSEMDIVRILNCIIVLLGICAACGGISVMVLSEINSKLQRIIDRIDYGKRGYE